jgi:hypothetical protein
MLASDFVTSVPKFYGLYKHVGLEILIDAVGIPHVSLNQRQCQYHNKY